MNLLKRTPQLIRALAAVLLLTILLLPMGPRGFTPKASAAADWFRSDGSKFSGDAKTYFDNNFLFLNTQTIVDKGTQQKYLTASVPAYDVSISDGTGRAFMYWPVSDNGTILDNKSPCMGGFEVGVGYLQTKQTSITFVPTSSGSGGACTINNKPLSFYSGNITDKVKNDTLPSAGNFFAKGAIAQKVVSIFSWWNNSAIVTAGYNEVLPEISKSSKLNVAGALDKIRADLSKKSSDAEVRDLGDLSQVRYFSTLSCYDSAKGGYKAFVAIKPGTAGYGYMFHYNNGDASQYIQNNWKSDQQSCLTGGREYNHNPGYEAGLVSNGGQSTIWLGDEAQYLKNPTPEQLAIMNGGGFSGGVGGKAGGTDLDCENNAGVLGWIICPVVRAINGAANWLDNTIQQQLTINIDQYFGDAKAGKGVYKVWSTFRTLALSLLVIIALVMVIGQAINFGPFDAYTVKKVLPRILAAVILIALSWELGRFLVQFSNDLGTGVSDMFYRVLPSDMQRVNIGGISGFLTYGVAGGAIIALGIVGVLSLGLTAILALFIGFLIIIFRQLIIVLCVVTAPIALVAFILPNTQKVWKFWKESFQGALLIFPLITGFIAAGHVMAAFQNSINSTDVFNNVVTLIFYIGPYFLLPLVFKLASGIMSTLGGMVNDRGRGAFDRLKKFRAQQPAQRLARAKAGGFQDRGIGRVYNRVGRGIQVGRRGHFGVGRQGQAGLATATLAQNEEALRNNGMLRELRNFDDANAVMALSGGTGRGAREAARDLFTDAHGNYDQARAEKALAAANAVGYSRQNAAAAMQTMAQNKSRAIRAGDIASLQNGINRLAGNNDQERENMEYNYQYFSREAGRGDLGGSWHTEDIQARGTALAAAVPGMSQEEAMRHVTALDGIGRTEVPSLVRGYPAQMRQYADTIQTMMQHGSTAERNTAAQHLLEMQKALPYASDENKRIINQLLTGRDASGAVVTGPAGPEPQYVDYNNASTSIEDQLARAARTGISGTALSRSARTYDRETGTAPGAPGSPLPPPAP